MIKNWSEFLNEYWKFSNKTETTESDEQFIVACRDGDIDSVKNLLPLVDPSIHDNDAIQQAAENGHIEIVKILLQDKRVDPTADDNYAIIVAKNRRHTEIVKLLLQDKRVDPVVIEPKKIQEKPKERHGYPGGLPRY